MRACVRGEGNVWSRFHSRVVYRYLVTETCEVNTDDTRTTLHALRALFLFSLCVAIRQAPSVGQFATRVATLSISEVHAFRKSTDAARSSICKFASFAFVSKVLTVSVSYLGPLFQHKLWSVPYCMSFYWL